MAIATPEARKHGILRMQTELNKRPPSPLTSFDPTTMKTESEGKVGDSATLRAVKELAFGSVSESGIRL